MVLWMIPSISIMICSTIVLILIYSYSFYIERKKFLGIWIISWSIYLAAQVITLVIANETSNKFLLISSYVGFLISMLLLVFGTYSFLDKKMPLWCSIVVVSAIIWNIASTLLKAPFYLGIFPITIILGVSTIWVGAVFLYYRQGPKILYNILGVSFILWGIHKMDYPFLRRLTWFAPWGYIISAGFSLIITISFIIIYFEKVRAELIEVQQGLLASEKRLVTLIENQRDIIFELDSNGFLTFLSPTCLKITGYSEKDLKGKSFVDFMGSNYWKQVKENNLRDTHFEKILDRADGSTIFTDIYLKANYEPDGTFKGVFGSVHDITENKLLNEAREYDKLKTEFFANISHELRTPLNVILASTQLLELYNKGNNKENISEKVDKTVVTVKQNIYRLLRLINNLIDITRVDNGFFELQCNNHNIVNVVEEITLSVVEYIESKGISIQFDTDVEEKIIACDADKIERVMLNLLSNSAKYTNAGGTILVKVSDGEEFITISVKDSGIGIPKDKQGMIFERFRQVDKSLSRNTEGSGIGLSLVKAVIELHGGTIKVESTYGFGSEFIISLPVKSLDEDTKNDKFEPFDVKKTAIEFSDIYA